MLPGPGGFDIKYRYKDIVYLIEVKGDGKTVEKGYG